ncbi:DUF3298 and DUF4163 domain-containing protein [Kamptonema cortianum]|nr:DUF3298 and DUF4163 domain-containing protein [Geitlerinema splendidum]MDK3156877.1 DUF3298 and DUF4163 domain-containing protein [Kamptonema cortianum]
MMLISVIGTACLIGQTKPVMMMPGIVSGGEPGRYEYQATIPVFSGDSVVLKLANKELDQRRAGLVKDFLLVAKEDDGERTVPYSFELGYTVSLARQEFVSVLLSHYEHTGGAHPNSYSHGVNIGMKDGTARLLELDDLLKDRKQKQAFLDQVIWPKVNEVRYQRVNLKTDRLVAEKSYSFVVSSKNLTIIFDRYEIGAYVEGEYVVKFAWADIENWMDPAVLRDIRKS